MAKAPLNESAFDSAEYKRAEKQFRLVEKDLPEDALIAVAREVVRRLAFRMPRNAQKAGFPTKAEIERLCDALLSSDNRAADRVILEARQDGAAVEQIYLGYVAAAARRLGDLWDADKITFVDVTLACGKLFRIIRGLRHVIAPSIIENRAEHPAMFALVPGETHTLGIEIATDIFRRNGWDIDMMIGMDHETILDKAELRNYRAIVLVANSDVLIARLTRLVLALRISHPLAMIVVAGNILDHHPDIETLVGADDVIKDIEGAVERLKDVVELPAN
ncbi:cobalamin B12-binding domain-containing protein [Yoonia litorea]|uniref:Methanogenic corrinoid protein MtbC1 n=1 Tax=Yoonia litorea TaxID=1123755 RepID=A0A1I6MCM5_9RHOB|nr:B12-binding domain-containing protein [Yoonia litorea]SFS13342.1 Methanogenic corrinoid protein MtbC1 [Yoonia litorea]